MVSRLSVSSASVWQRVQSKLGLSACLRDIIAISVIEFVVPASGSRDSHNYVTRAVRKLPGLSKFVSALSLSRTGIHAFLVFQDQILHDLMNMHVISESHRDHIGESRNVQGR